MFEKSVLSRSREKDQSSPLFFLPWFVPTIFLFQIASCLPRAFSLRLLLRVEKKESGGCRCCQDYVRAFRIPRIIALSGDTIGESGDNRIMLILLRRYSFIPDVARVTSERISKFFRYRPFITLRERGRIFSLSREPSGTPSIFMRFYLHSSQSLRLSLQRFFLSYNSRQSGLASYRNPPIRISEILARK